VLLKYANMAFLLSNQRTFRCVSNDCLFEKRLFLSNPHLCGGTLAIFKNEAVFGGSSGKKHTNRPALAAALEEYPAAAQRAFHFYTLFVAIATLLRGHTLPLANQLAKAL